MSAGEKLKTRNRERDALLASIVGLLESDLRVVAAWLGGSLGRGTADNLSDIDIYVVVSEQYGRFVFSATREFVSRVPGLLFTEYAPRNAPANGAYLLSMFHGDTGPHQVDWYWITDRVEQIPANTLVLFNNADIPYESAQNIDGKTADSAFDLENEIALFWALAAISAKKIARKHPWSAIAILGYLRAALNRIAWHLGVSDNAPGHVDSRSDPPPVTALGQLEELKALVRELESLSPEIVAAGLAAPPIMAEELAPLIDLTFDILSETP